MVNEGADEVCPSQDKPSDKSNEYTLVIAFTKEGLLLGSQPTTDNCPLL